LFLLCACAVFIAFVQLIPVQQAAFGETQGLVLLLGEAGAFITLGYIAEARRKNRHHLVPRLIWLSFVPLLLSIGYCAASGEQRSAAGVQSSRGWHS